MLYKLILISFFIFLNQNLVVAQQKTDTLLKKELDEIMIKDQQYRGLMDFHGTEKDSLSKSFKIPADSLGKHLWFLQNKLDSSNWVKIETIFKQQGYPGKSLVGVPTNEVAWYVLQHNLRKISQYFPLIESAGKNGELPYVLVAKMQDRQLMMMNEEQVFGTQATSLLMLNPKTGKKEYQWIVWPIKDSKNVNSRRKEAGFENTVEENAKQLGAEYRANFTVEEVNDLRLNRNK